MGKRLSHLVAEIVTDENLNAAFDEVVGSLGEGTPKRFKKQVKKRRAKYEAKRGVILQKLKEEISNGTFRVKKYKEFWVKDGPKWRKVQSPVVVDRISCNAIMRVVEKYLYPTVIKTSAASIKGRGMHKLFRKMRSDIDHDREGTLFYYKNDIQKFYESIDQDGMIAYIKTRIKDPVLLPMLISFVRLMKKGLSIGLRSSQCFGNILLSPLDHRMKEVEHCRYYYRYCDDTLCLARTKKELWRLRDIIHEEIEKLGLRVKADEAVRPTSEGIDFLGFVYDGEKSRLRKRTKQKAARKLAKVKSRKRRQELVGSLKGMAKWGDCKHLYKVLTGKDMKDIGEAKCKVAYKDGKKRFKGREISPRELDKKPFVIVDFERDVIPRWEQDRYRKDVAQAGGNEAAVEPMKKKYLISLIYDGVPRKMWTGMEENKVRLEYMAENVGFPCSSSVMADYSGRYPLYTLCSAKGMAGLPTDEEVERIVKQFNMSVYEHE
jgi:RNA-directed DNA polymerase